MLKRIITYGAACMLMLGAPLLHAAPASGTSESAKSRIAIISSYHKSYLWSQDTHQGVVDAMLETGWLESRSQVSTFTQHDAVETGTAVIQKYWMDTKYKNSPSEIASTVHRISASLESFQPDIILLGDDNATNYIGNLYLDSDIPVVFWGVNGLPLKYGLVDSLEHPGHNITGTYQTGYLPDGLRLLVELVPNIKTLAILSDDSPTGRSKTSELRYLSDKKELPVQIPHIIITNDYEAWKQGALQAAKHVDAFIMLNHNTLRDASGKAIPQMEAGRWYLTHINKPEVSHEKQFVQEGMLVAVDDSGYKQGYQATLIAYDILHHGRNPADIKIIPPSRGAFMLNKQRAMHLGLFSDIQQRHSNIIEQIIEDSQALQP